MEMNQRIEICGTCTQRKFSDQGIVCGLTMEKPTFELNCPDFIVDERQMAKKIKSSAQLDYDYLDKPVETQSSWKTVLSVIVFIIILVRIIARIM